MMRGGRKNRKRRSEQTSPQQSPRRERTSQRYWRGRSTAYRNGSLEADSDRQPAGGKQRRKEEGDAQRITKQREKERGNNKQKDRRGVLEKLVKSDRRALRRLPLFPEQESVHSNLREKTSQRKKVKMRTTAEAKREKRRKEQQGKEEERKRTEERA
jgi:hypothetical protein